jgi:hypothetical protein
MSPTASRNSPSSQPRQRERLPRQRNSRSFAAEHRLRVDARTRAGALPPRRTSSSALPSLIDGSGEALRDLASSVEPVGKARKDSAYDRHNASEDREERCTGSADLFGPVRPGQALAGGNPGRHDVQEHDGYCKRNGGAEQDAENELEAGSSSHSGPYPPYPRRTMRPCACASARSPRPPNALEPANRSRYAIAQAAH